MCCFHWWLWRLKDTDRFLVFGFILKYEEKRHLFFWDIKNREQKAFRETVEKEREMKDVRKEKDREKKISTYTHNYTHIHSLSQRERKRKKVMGEKDKRDTQRERERESNAKERRWWTETRETTKQAAELNCLLGPTILILYVFLFICVFVFFIYYRTSLISTRFSFFLFLFICFLGGVIWKLKKKLALGNLAWLAIGRPFGFCLFIDYCYYLCNISSNPFLSHPRIQPLFAWDVP